jgi:alkanesulfonate monooxygenase SsuD/methylene tetrahydromethanopterin reductase-like flavin-dependent oxidoreductase (luciferase family)
VVDPALCLGLELPTGGGAPEPWRAAAEAEAAGFGTAWVVGGALDACTLAGALVPATRSVLLGVVASTGPDRRAPSVLARDVTAVDVLSSGRAAVLLRGGDVDRLAEAVTVCRLLFTEDAPSFQGRYLTLVGAANRPPPVRPGGPPVLVQPPPGAVAAVAGAALGVADALVVGGGPGEVAAWRAAAGGTAVLWRGEVAGPTGLATLAPVADAGADGVVVSVPAAAGPSWPDAVREMGAALTDLWPVAAA